MAITQKWRSTANYLPRRSCWYPRRAQNQVQISSLLSFQKLRWRELCTAYQISFWAKQYVTALHSFWSDNSGMAIKVSGLQNFLIFPCETCKNYTSSFQMVHFNSIGFPFGSLNLWKVLLSRSKDDVNCQQGTFICAVLKSGIGGSGDPRRMWEEMGERERERERKCWKVLLLFAKWSKRAIKMQKVYILPL